VEGLDASRCITSAHIIGPGLTRILTRAITHTFAPHDMHYL
jgi:hypothetical protein